MEPLKTILITTATAAALFISSQGRLLAQNQPSGKQPGSGYTLATANYNFLIASGFLCEMGGHCRAEAQDVDGNTIDISGVGTLRVADHSATGAGSFNEKTRNGVIMSTGVWTATELVSFQPYGTAPFDLQREFPELRSISTYAMRRPMPPNPLMPVPMAQPLAAGGEAVIRIRLMPDVGTPEEAVLTINCAKGKAPQDHQVDGVKLSVAGGLSFDQQVSGRTVFVLVGPSTLSAAAPSPSNQH